MSIVSISEAARLTGKSRRTLHRHIDAGRISKSHTLSGEQGIEISELIRVYGELKAQPVTSGQSEPRLQRATGDGAERPSNAHHVTSQNDTEIRRIHDLEKEVESLNRLLSSKQETIDTLKSALKLLEHKQEKDDLGNTDAIPTKEPEPSLNEVEATNNEKGLLGRFKKLFS